MTTDEKIAERQKKQDAEDLKDQDHALDDEEKLEVGLDDSMDASDPPAATAPGDHGDPVPSSGFTDKDRKRD